jgi:hypothetical protein
VANERTRPIRVVYQVQIDRGDTVTNSILRRDHEGAWPFPNFPAVGEAVVIDYDQGGFSVDHGAGVVELTPAPVPRPTSLRVEQITYRPSAPRRPEVVIYLLVDGLTSDPEAQINALKQAGFVEKPAQG